MDGSERRRLAGLRSAIESVPPGRKPAIVNMARMLGPDRLGRMDSEFRRVKEIADGGKAVDKPTVAAMALRLRPDELPGEVRSMRLGWLVLSEPPGGAFAERGITTVGDFITRTGRELTDVLGVPGTAVDEARTRLLGYGIRTVDNPPLR